jgi:RNA recognition motif-containing protein
MIIDVTNLGDKITESSLEAIFSTYGSVSSSNVVAGDATQNAQGSGFVEMPHRDEAIQAIERLNGAIINGRSMIVKEAKP